VTGPLVPPSPERRRRLNALADLHSRWVDEHLPSASFDAGRARAQTPSDYNLHYLDVNPDVAAEDEFQRQARVIMGLDPMVDPPIERF
jgi:hypothetical protein